ncbi:IspD/TarI family cytidylyltransferase [Murimonas intestini]|uniref:2-C-methyl-D-erythritol 4-phosphate cytidylyltransferase n=1 Tax=Murimonas intestini TaxID=1337051 RepID=A0AB73SZ46_9FIRM|nr:IspD/TarI family cytidylyltransferase [Murimonas intestini]MCR1842967.1 2-C-methyl-D-erythritol 4-phosphate cytidylyltransferase [Murimonas intestini]MCR1864784.1 2-C-methyl-D-erythritol 4-phosphate cytidylyltransferase [Murimonas intestini]MCR1885436.1 2-C-methyl-D-erythritol 4-phosphate cytidylyltransferase [Murimonas intestini]
MNFALILSGGVGARMKNVGVPKQYIEIDGKPIIMFTLEKFESNNRIDKIIVVASKQWHSQIEIWKEVYQINKLVGIAEAGDSRQESILNGLEYCGILSKEEMDKVIIHDAVRPFVSEHLISTCIDTLDKHEGCMPVLPIHDTVYQSQDGKNITKLLDRNTLFAGQAPEAFRLKRYLEINRMATKEVLKNTSGTSMIAYRYSMDVCMISGEDTNFKITTPSDLIRFRTIIGEKNESI